MKVNDIRSFFKSPKSSSSASDPSSSGSGGGGSQVVQVPLKLSRNKRPTPPSESPSPTSSSKSSKTSGGGGSSGAAKEKDSKRGSSNKSKSKVSKIEFHDDDEDPVPKTTTTKKQTTTTSSSSSKAESKPKQVVEVMEVDDEDDEENPIPKSKSSKVKSPTKDQPSRTTTTTTNGKMNKSNNMTIGDEDPIPKSKSTITKVQQQEQSSSSSKHNKSSPSKDKSSKSIDKQKQGLSKVKRDVEEDNDDDDDDENPIPKAKSKKRKTSRLLESSDDDDNEILYATPSPTKKKPTTTTTTSYNKKEQEKPTAAAKQRNSSPPSKKSTAGGAKREKSPAPSLPPPKTTPSSSKSAASKSKKGTELTTPKTKAKHEEDLRTPEEKKRAQQSNYFKMISRGGPKHLGAKEMPIGAPNCLASMTFVQTGVLDSFEHDDIKAAIEKYGGRMTSAVSRKTNYLLVGDEPGETKRKKAKELGIPTMSEDEFLDLIRKSNPNAQPHSQTIFGIDDNDEAEAEQEEIKPEPKIHTRESSSRSKSKSPRKEDKKPSLKISSQDSGMAKTESPSKTPTKRSVPKIAKEEPRSSSQDTTTSTTSSTSTTTSSSLASAAPAGTEMWVEKYRPKSLKNLVGQTTDKSVANKLLRWLQVWFTHHGKSDDKAKASWPGLKDPDGKTFKAALVSGPPGIGKTTMAHLICEQVGLDYIELNASDTRNKKGLHEMLGDLLSSKSLHEVGGHALGHMARRHVLIMDEVDGMSGNEDRGGIQELIGLIKSSRIPIICICNDRNAQKIRSLANYCYDLRVYKPTIEQLKGFIQSICYKEKLKLPYDSVLQLVKSTDFDIRQIINQLQLLKETDPASAGAANAYHPKKDLSFGPWDVARKVFSASEHVGMSIIDKSNLFFQDYNMGPLFVQENYVKWTPLGAKGDKYKTLDLLSYAAESIATGDLVDNLLRRSNNWSLLPTQAIFSSLLPGEYMEGNEVSGIEFPRWLGQNSHRNKNARLLQQLHTHVHLVVSGSLEALNMDYLPYLRRTIVNPLVAGEIDESVQVMQDYNLLREDLDNINELALWTGMKNPMEKLDSKTKAAFTRGVNKEILPYSMVKATKGGRGKKGAEETATEGLEEEDETGVTPDGDEEEEDDGKIEADAMIKMKKRKTAATTATTKAKAKAPAPAASTNKSGKKKRIYIDDDDDDESEEEDDTDDESSEDEDVKPAKKGKGSSGSGSQKRKKQESSGSSSSQSQKNKNKKSRK